MKNSIKTFAVAIALIAASFSANADDKETKKSMGFGTSIYPTKSGKINLHVDKVSADAHTILLLKNENGQIVYEELVGKKIQKFSRVLNVDELSTGKYEIEIISKGEKQIKSFVLTEKTSERVLAIK